MSTRRELVRGVCARQLTKARRREPVAAPEGPGEVRRLAISHQPRDVAYGDRRLLDEQLCRGRHPPREQILVKCGLTELRIGSLHLARRAGHGAGDGCEREAAAVVACDDDAREQIQPPSGRKRLRLHILDSDRAGLRGTRRSRAQGAARPAQA